MQKVARYPLFAAFVVALFSISPAPAETPPAASRAEMPSLAPMLEKVLPGVVSIAVHGRVPEEENPLLSDPFFRRFFDLPEKRKPRQREFQAAGSGVIVDPENGYVITNVHVVEEADGITVVLEDGRRVQARKVGMDPETDIAVLQIPVDGLTGLTFGNSDELRVGDYVVAVGNPFGLEQTVTSGIVSALGRTGLGLESYESFIQTDASINPGNSGGALVNLRGELVGINSVIVGPSGGNVGIGFAIPINMAKQIMDQLIAHGKVSRGQLGVRVQDITPELARAFNIDGNEGALIASVMAGSAAEDAGLKAGDAVISVNGEKVENASDLRTKIGLLPVGSDVTLEIIRDGGKEEVVVQLGEPTQASVEVPDEVAALSGVTLGSIKPGSPLYGKAEGAVILKIKGGSKAAQAGLRPGDVIVSVNRQPVASPDDVVRLANETEGDVLLQVIRKGMSLFVVIG